MNNPITILDENDEPINQIVANQEHEVSPLLHLFFKCAYENDP